MAPDSSDLLRCRRLDMSGSTSGVYFSVFSSFRRGIKSSCPCAKEVVIQPTVLGHGHCSGKFALLIPADESCTHNTPCASSNPSAGKTLKCCNGGGTAADRTSTHTHADPQCHADKSIWDNNHHLAWCTDNYLCGSDAELTIPV